MEGCCVIKHPSEGKMHFGYLACLQSLPHPRAVENTKKPKHLFLFSLLPPSKIEVPEFGLFEWRVCKRHFNA